MILSFFINFFQTQKLSFDKAREKTRFSQIDLIRWYQQILQNFFLKAKSNLNP